MGTATVRTPVQFDAPSRRVEGGYAVYPNALLFEEGHYPDKQFSLGPADMDAAIADFTPVGGAIEHTPFLRGRALTVRSIRRDEANPKLLRGEVAVPLGLDELIDDAERSLSAEWDRETKRLVGAALTLNPRIKGASLVAKFAAEAMTHDDDPALLKETIKALAAFCACQAEAPPTRTEETAMTRKEQLKQYLDSLEGDADIDDGAASLILFPDAGEGDDMDDDAPPASFANSPEAIAMQTRIDALEAQRREDRKREIARDAAAFAEGEVRAGRATPFEAKNLVVLFAQAAHDDDALKGTVTFSQGDKAVTGTRVEALKAVHAQRPARPLGPQLAGNAAGPVLAQFSTQSPDLAKEAKEQNDAFYANRRTSGSNGTS